MKQEFKAHPIMFFSIIKPFLFILLIPVARGTLQYIIDGAPTKIIGLESVVFAVIVLFSVAKCVCFRLICFDKNIIIKEGVFLAKKSVIPISELSSVQTQRNPFDYIFGCVTYKINTEAGVKSRADYNFKLSLKDSKRLSALLYGKQPSEPVKFSLFKIAILAAATSSAFTGIVVGVPIVNNTGKLLGVALNEMLFNELNNVSSKLKTYFPPIVNTVTLLVLIGYGISFLYLFFKYINFKIFLNKDNFEIRSGLFIRTRTSFKRSAVNNVKIEQSPLMLLLKRYSMKVNVGGYEETKSESQVLVPSGARKEIRNLFSDYFPFLASNGKSIKPHHNLITQNRFLFWPEIYFCVTMAISIILAYKFDEFSRLIFFLTLVIMITVIYFAYLCLVEYRLAKVQLGNTIFARSKRGLRSYELYCPKENVGEIKIIRFPPDLQFKTCKLKIVVRAESSDSITVRNLDYETVMSEILNCFELSE